MPPWCHGLRLSPIRSGQVVLYILSNFAHVNDALVIYWFLPHDSAKEISGSPSRATFACLGQKTHAAGGRWPAAIRREGGTGRPGTISTERHIPRLKAGSCVTSRWGTLVWS